MTQEIANNIFASELGQQLSEIFVTSDDKPFIRRHEAVTYAHNTLKEEGDPSEYKITVWYPE